MFTFSAKLTWRISLTRRYRYYICPGVTFLGLPSSEYHTPNIHAEVLNPNSAPLNPNVYSTTKVQSGQYYVDNSDLFISPINTDGMESIFTLVTLYNKTNRGSGFTNAIVETFAFATPSLAPLVLGRLKLLPCFWGDPSPIQRHHERRINLITGFRYHRPFTTYVIFRLLQAHSIVFGMWILR